MKNFASRLSQALELRNMKASELSKKTKVAEGTISCYINGRYEAKQTRVKVFADALDVNPAWLMGYDVPMEPERKDEENKKSDQSVLSELTPQQAALFNSFNQLNEEGQQKALDYVDDLVCTGRYKKDPASGVAQEA